MSMNIFRGLTAVACAAVAGLFAGNPAATTPVNPVNEGIQQAPTNYRNNAQRQMAQNNINQVRQYLAQNYTAGGGGMVGECRQRNTANISCAAVATNITTASASISPRAWPKHKR